MRRLSGILPIVVYGIFLVLMVLWRQQYYLTWTAGIWGVLFYTPYYCGGAFLMCFFLARLCFFINKSAGIWECFLYLLLLLPAVYIPEGLGEALMESYKDGYTTLFKNWSPWLYPLIQDGVSNARVILAESAVGFSAGSFWQMRKEKKRRAEGNLSK